MLPPCTALYRLLDYCFNTSLPIQFFGYCSRSFS
jgi:hypothetical protein